MFGSNRNAAKAYSSVGMETGILTASPHQLITVLFDGSLVAIVKAKQNMESGNVAEKGIAISKAIMLIDSGLRGGLNLDAGGDLAQNLNDLYSYMVQQLMQANLSNQVERLDEVYHLLNELKGAWVTIGQQAQQQAAASNANQTQLGV